MAMGKAGYESYARKLMEFCEQVISPEGYLMHKYRADTSLGSSWHPWLQQGKSELPIQEDETALILVAFWDYYQNSKDIEFVVKHFQKLILAPANFMVEYRSLETGLPLPTYDLWEEEFGVSTFTSSAVYAGLTAASNFAGILGEKELAKKWATAAAEVKNGILKYLYSSDLKIFIKQISYTNEGLNYDNTLDTSSFYGVLKFGIIDFKDEKAAKIAELIEEKLNVNGGIARYENDDYFRVSENITGNPWIISTLWLAQYYIQKATTLKELEPAYEKMDWTLKYAQKSGMLSEQINPHTGEQVSATPLIWSQAIWTETYLLLNQKIVNLSQN